MLNEAKHVDQLVEDLAAQDVGAELELIVAAGGSTDGCVERLHAAAARASLTLEVVDNPRRWAGPGLNRALASQNCRDSLRIEGQTR
jgi:glycosyltransferase involved in cell wall biosynthesis